MNSERAKEFVINSVISPALQSPAVSANIKKRIKHSLQIVRSFHRIGDLYQYLSRFTNESDEIYTELRRANLESFESIRSEFQTRFSPFLDQITTIDSFFVGQQYSAWDISTCAKTYDIQAGMYLSQNETQINAVLIKATFENGKYPNKWITQGLTIKFYFYSRNKKFVKNDGSNFKNNEAILRNHMIPILVFTKLDSNAYKYEGIFQYQSHAINDDGSRYFILRKRFDIDETYTPEAAEALSQSSTTPDRPRKVRVVVEQFIRNPQVVTDTLQRANDVCENCGKVAPFQRETDGSPFLEVHHLTPLSQDGPDAIGNTVALCPNCHRELHHGQNGSVQTQRLQAWLLSVYAS